MPYNSWGIAGQPIGGQIQRSRYAPDIQEQLARQMLSEGTSTAPVQHWTQGLARLLQGYMGGQIANRAAQEREQRQQGQQQTLAQALAAMQGRPGGIETTPGGTSIDWQAQPGSAKNAAAILAQNPDLAGMGFQLQMSEAEREQARQQRMADIADERAYKKGETADERAWREKMQGQQFAQQKALAGMRQGDNAQWVPMPNPADPNLPPVLVDQRTGNMKAVPGLAGQSKPMTEGQANAALYADRMRASEGDISRLEGAGLSYADKIKGAIPGVGNALVSKDYQQLQQAQRDFLNAVLRRESGAVISDKEFESGSKQYFPQPGDTPETLQQKARNRAIALEGISRAGGPNYHPKSVPPMTGGWSIQKVQ